MAATPRRETPTPQENVTSESLLGEVRIQARPNANADQNLKEYIPYEPQWVLGDINTFYSSSTDDLISEIIERIVEYEGPLSFRVLAQRVSAHWGIAKIGSRVAQRVKRIVSRAKITQTRHGQRTFLWPTNVDPEHYQIFRVPRTGRVRRNAEDIPPQEIANAALYVLEKRVSMPVSELVVETARLFGFARTGKEVAKSMRLGIKVLSARDKIAIQEGIITRLGPTKKP